MESVEGVNNVSYDVGMTKVVFVEPIIHGSQRSVVTTRMLYFAAIDAWKQHKDMEFTIDYWDVKFYSKKSGLYRREGDDYKRLFEYVIKARDQIGHKKLDVVIKPRLKGMYYRSKKTKKFEKFKLLGEEGTLLFIQSSYMDWNEILEFLSRIFERIDINPAYLAEIRIEDSKITTLERHVRVSKTVELAVATTMIEFEDYLREQPDAKVWPHIDKSAGGYKFYKVTFKEVDIIPETFRKLGLAFYIKMYRLREDNPKSAPANLRNSFKLEAGIDPEKSDSRIPIEMEQELIDFMDSLVISILHKTGVVQENLLEDDHFKPQTRQWKEVQLINFSLNAREIRDRFSRNEEFGRKVLKNDLARAVLKLVTLHGWVSMKDLAAELGYSTRRIREIVQMLEELGLVYRVRDYGTWVYLKNRRYMQKMLKQRIEIAEKEFGLGDAIQNVKAKVARRLKRRLTILSKRLLLRRAPKKVRDQLAKELSKKFKLRIVAEAEADPEDEDIVPVMEFVLETLRNHMNKYLARELDAILQGLKVQRSPVPAPT